MEDLFPGKAAQMAVANRDPAAAPAWGDTTDGDLC